MLKRNRTTYLHLSQKRDIKFPFPLSSAGEFTTPSNVNYSMNYNTLEFCLRLRSDDLEARDELDGETYHYRFPHLFIKRPGVPHRYRVKSSRYAIFFIYPPDLLPEFEKIGMSSSPPGIEFDLTPELENLIDRFIALIPRSHTRGAAEKFDLIAFQAIENIYMRKFVATDQEGDTAENKIREIASYLQLHFADRVDINDILETFDMSRRRFFREWAKRYELSPLQYINDLKIKEAKRLLSLQNIQVKEISERLGFDNYSYFIQMFRRYTDGVPPGEYRKQINSGPTQCS